MLYQRSVRNSVAAVFSVVRAEYGRDDKGFYVEQRDFVPNTSEPLATFNGEPVDFKQPTQRLEWFENEADALEALNASGLNTEWPVHLFSGNANFSVGDKVVASTQDEESPDMIGVVVTVDPAEIAVDFGENGKKYYGKPVITYVNSLVPFCLERAQ